MKELKKWENQRYAVNITTKTVFEIDAVEVIENDVVIFGGKNSNSSRNLHTVAEAHYLEEINQIF
jgi:Flp pilus assembly CpaE family ATPase